MFCLSGAPNCGANGFLTGYNAAAGYDLASGLGSIDATQLVQNWSKVTFKASATALTVNCRACSPFILLNVATTSDVCSAGNSFSPKGMNGRLAASANSSITGRESTTTL